MNYNEIKNNEEINTYIRQADLALSALGYTEHSFAHVTVVAEKAGYILKTLGYDDRTVELAKIAGYLHDIGNLVNRSEQILHYRNLCLDLRAAQDGEQRSFR